MVFLAETTASNISSVSLNGYFTSDYDVYKIYLDGLYITGIVDAVVMMTFNTTGSYTEQTSSYAFVFSDSRVNFSTNAITDSAWNYSNSTSSIIINYNNSTQAAGGVTEIVLYNPMSTVYHKYVTGMANGRVTEGCWGAFRGVWQSTTAITGVKFKTGNGTLNARKIRLYGIKNS